MKESRLRTFLGGLVCLILIVWAYLGNYFCGEWARKLSLDHIKWVQANISFKLLDLLMECLSQLADKYGLACLCVIAGTFLRYD